VNTSHETGQARRTLHGNVTAPGSTFTHRESWPCPRPPRATVRTPESTSSWRQTVRRCSSAARTQPSRTLRRSWNSRPPHRLACCGRQRTDPRFRWSRHHRLLWGTVGILPAGGPGSRRCRACPARNLPPAVELAWPSCISPTRLPGSLTSSERFHPRWRVQFRPETRLATR
jgi:hypothetical protein